MQLRHECNRGVKCKYAHNPEELIIKQCREGDSCPFIRIKDKPTGLWKVLNKEKVCHYKHPAETLENYFLRLGWELRAEQIRATYIEEAAYKEVKPVKEDEAVKNPLLPKPKEDGRQHTVPKGKEANTETKVKRCKAIIKKSGKVCNNKIKAEDMKYDFCGKHKRWRTI